MSHSENRCNGANLERSSRSTDCHVYAAMKTDIIYTVLGFLFILGKCDGLVCRRCLHMEMEPDVLDDSDLELFEDPQCKVDSDNTESVSCGWEDGMFHGSDIYEAYEGLNDTMDVADMKDYIYDYYNSKGWDATVCQVEESALKIDVYGQAMTIRIWSRGCKLISSDIKTPGCTNEVKDHENALMHQVFAEVGFGEVSGRMCFCDTDNCNTQSLVEANGAAARAPLWATLPCLALIATLLNS